MQKKWTSIIILLCATQLHAQINDENLIYNPSFEEYIECPRHIDAYGILTDVEGWYQPTLGSVDYYNKCGSKECNIPDNKLGTQPPHSGQAYCGIYCSKTDYREYLQTQLKTPLIKGKRYKLTFYVSLSEYSPHIIATIGGLFTRERICDSTYGILMQKQQRAVLGRITQTINTTYKPQIVNPTDSLLDDMQNWIPICGEFIAEGGEEFLTIGNFYPASQSNYIDKKDPSLILPGAYYYIDDVSLYCLDCNDLSNSDYTENHNSQTSTSQEATYTIGTTIILKDIFFAFNKSTILQQSHKELIKLFDLLTQYPTMQIEISGHTDNQGSPEYNMRLSEQRACAIATYLINKGIDSKRITYKGYGESKPITSNATKEGRATNRRVEFKILTF